MCRENEDRPIISGLQKLVIPRLTRNLAVLLLICVIPVLAACGGRAMQEEEVVQPLRDVSRAPSHVTASRDTSMQSPPPHIMEQLNFDFEWESELSSGHIFLYGEFHGCGVTMARQLEIWGDYYHNYGMRHLFLESAYFTAQFLNMWMQADDDEILLMLSGYWVGTSLNNPYTLAFFRTIKSDFPKTIFHGTDVGHQSDTIGERFLVYLINNDLRQTESYRLTRENIAQYRRFREVSSHAIRAYYKPQNFVREFDRLVDQDIMAFHGMAHVELAGYFLSMNGLPSMATTLRNRYRSALHTFDMTDARSLPVPMSAPLLRPNYRGDVINVNGVDFYATHFGVHTFSTIDIVAREFWRLEDAYEVFSDNEVTRSVLLFDNFPMFVEAGQVFVVDIHYRNGTVGRYFYRASGFYLIDRPAAQRIVL